MLLNLEEKKLFHVDALNQVCYFYKDVQTAITEKKTLRLCVLFMLMVVVIALVIFVNPLIIGFIIKWLIGTWGFSFTVSKVIATSIVKSVTMLVRKIGKVVVLKINR